MTNIKKLCDELESNLDVILLNKKFKADKKTLERLLSTWKGVHAKYIANEKDGYTLNVLYAFQSAVSYHLYEVDIETAKRFIKDVLTTERSLG